MNEEKRSLIWPLGLFGFFLLYVFTGIYAQWVWFDSLSYLFVYKTIIMSKIGIGVAIGVAVFLVLLTQLLIAKRITKKSPSLFVRLSLGLSILAGLMASASWEVVLRYIHRVSFGATEPIFSNDIGFYIFTLPFYEFALVVLAGTCLLSFGVCAAMYVTSSKVKRKISASEDPLAGTIEQVKVSLSEPGRVHLSIIGGVFLLILACFFYLKRFSILFSQKGAVYGAGFADITVTIPLYYAVTGIAVVLAAISFSYVYLRNIKLLISGATLLGLVFFGGTFVAGLTQSLYVEPNEFDLEKEYLQHNIDFTLAAYGLDNVQTREFPITYNLTSALLDENHVTIDNVRLWDWRPLLTTYRQIQLFRTYYDFIDVDVDRYVVDGELRQLMVSPRELDVNQLDAKAKTWVNRHLFYTHGYGAVVSPVNKVTEEGLPDLLVQNIPPEVEDPILEIDQPRIYFGEKTDDYVVVGTKNPEFDYPLGDTNQETEYDGKAGIPLNSLWHRIVFALSFGSKDLLLSTSFTDNSKILFHRNVLDRVETIAPFLDYDADPYIVIHEGRLVWIVDAYSTTNRYPYSESIGSINYVRNAVKVVVDAFDGSVTFFVIDESDPIVVNYEKMFPTLFKTFESMPDSLKAHIRYPEGLMRIQTQVYGTYHMTDPQVFYNKEDVWRAPSEIYRGSEVDLRPYYLIMRLPDAPKEGFYLITPLIPRGKDNLIAWFAAHADPETYGTLEVFELSKQELTYGPMQIEARIDQDPDISQLLTLWGQQGSEVIRGNLLIIPIEDSFMYIEPIYLKASANGALPEFKRVIVAYGDQLTMEESLEEGLNVIFGAKLQQVKKRIDSGDAPMGLEERFNQASQAYQEAQEALTAGDFATYGEKIQLVGELLVE